MVVYRLRSVPKRGWRSVSRAGVYLSVSQEQAALAVAVVVPDYFSFKIVIE